MSVTCAVRQTDSVEAPGFEGERKERADVHVQLVDAAQGTGQEDVVVMCGRIGVVDLNGLHVAGSRGRGQVRARRQVHPIPSLIEGAPDVATVVQEINNLRIVWNGYDLRRIEPDIRAPGGRHQRERPIGIAIE